MSASYGNEVLLAIDTATTRIVVAIGTRAGEPAGATELAGRLPPRRDAAPGRRAAARPSAGSTERRSRRSSSAPGPARSPGCASGSRPPRASRTAWAGRSSASPTGAALLAAAAAAAERVPVERLVLLLPAGPSDRILVRDGAAPALLPAGEEPELATGGRRWSRVDLDGRAPAEALARGERARAGWRPSCCARRRPGSRAGDADDLARLVPEYVTLPRGVAAHERGGGMVARPPLRLRIEPMRIEDLVVVHAIERASFAAPWPANAYRSELESNRLAHYLVARADDEIVGYGGMWLMVDEAHITTFAIHPAWRRQRIGERLLLAFLDLAIDRRAREATLEVRLSNLPARRLYEKYGFRPVGLRPRYYSDDDEDALIMTTEALTEPRDARADRAPARRARRVAGPGAPRRPRRAPGRDRDAGRPGRPRRRRGVSGSLVLAIESSCDETGIALIEDGRTIHANVVASQVALHAASGGIVPEVAARAHLRWIVPVLDEAWADAGVAWPDIDAVAVTYGPGLAGLAARRASTSRRRSPGSTTCRSSGSTTSRATSTRPGSPTGAAPRPSSRSSRSSTLVVSGGHTFLAEMRDHLTYRRARRDRRRRRGRGVRQGRPPARARLSGRAGDLARGRGRHASATASSRAPGSATRSTSASPASRPPRVASWPRPGPTQGLSDDPDAPLPPAVVAELAWGFQDAVVDVLATKTIRAARAAGARSIVLGGGRRRELGAAGPPGRRRRRARASRSSCRDPALCTDNGAMIGAAGARRFAAGERSGLDLDARPSLPLRGRRSMTGAARPRLDPADVRATLRAAGLRARHAPVAELPRRPRRARGDPRRGGADPGRPGPRDRARPRAS